MSAPLPTDRLSPGQIAAEAFHKDATCYPFAPAEWDRAAAAVLEHCAPVITAEQHAALLRRIADQQRALDEARGNLAIVARMLADAVGKSSSHHHWPEEFKRCSIIDAARELAVKRFSEARDADDRAIMRAIFPGENR